jgi:excisionase family DNA binding protein
MRQENRKTGPSYEQLHKRIMQLESRVEKLIESTLEPQQKEMYLDVISASKFLGISRVGIYRLMKKGELGFTHIGQQRRILVSELNKYTQKKKVNALPSIL